MIRTRVLVGSLLALAACAVLVADRWLAPWFPFLLTCLVLVGVLATRELVRLFPAPLRPPLPLAVAGVLGTTFANWYPLLPGEFATILPAFASPWEPILFVVVAVLLVGFLVEMYRYREPGSAVPRLALLLFTVAYLGVLGSFLAQIRWLRAPYESGLILTLTIFVPKCGDIGAFFTGTFLGRTRMTPILSPKKTWEGAAGGVLLSVITAVGLSFTGELFRHGILEAIAFGVIVSVAGMLGDLAESLIKRDCQTKDAAKSIPGFGGVLDVIDSVLFAAPVGYFWFRS